MEIKSAFIKTFLTTIVVLIGSFIAFLPLGLKIFNSFNDFLIWLSVLLVLIVFAILSKLTFKWIKSSEIIYGIWIAAVLYCWSPILFLPWFSDTWNSVSSATLYIIIGFAILLTGYFYRKKTDSVSLVRNLRK